MNIASKQADTNTMRGWTSAVLVAGLIAALIPQYSLAAGSITMQVSGLQANYTPGQAISGIVQVSYSKLIPRTSVMQAYLSGNKVSEISLYNYTQDDSFYSYTTKYFSYNLTAQGTNSWFEYPAQAFKYRIGVEGTCGGAYCNSSSGDNCRCLGYCTAPYRYPCGWSSAMTETWLSSVKANDGLKFIYNAANTLAVPGDANSDTLWSDAANTNPNAEVSMRAACGGEQYVGNIVWPDGWVRRTIQQAELEPAGNYRAGTIEPFDNSSLGSGRFKFGGGSGGIYKDGVYQQFGSNSGVFWNSNSTSGYIRIYNYNPSSEYTIIYLPPNGGHVCAYTSVKYPNSTGIWQAESKTISGAYCSRKQNYTYVHGFSSQIPPLQPQGCPPYVRQEDCNASNLTYGAVKVSGDDVVLSFNEGTMTVSAYTTSDELASTYSFPSGLDIGLLGIRAPRIPGISIIELRITNNGALLGSHLFNVSSCRDSDGDGYCSIAEGGADCNDTARDVNPKAQEVCNGIDDNCNGPIDEGFSIANKLLGTLCNNWTGSACVGQWVCTPDGRNVTCKSEHVPGELREICDNGIDDDCDGLTDDNDMKVVSGNPVPDCVCKTGETKSCGSETGVCKPGYRICMPNGEWSDCRDAKGPAQETCNRKDDDCNGIIDSIGGGDSIESTKCGCYGGALPSPEACNGIDDNCDGQTDNGVSCCSPGETRPCGVSNGACVQGTEACGRSNQWSGICTGGIQPGDIRVDSNCNRIPDCPVNELISGNCVCGNSTYMDGFCCSGFYSHVPCSNYNFSVWMVIAGGVILAVVAFWLVALKVAA